MTWLLVVVLLVMTVLGALASWMLKLASADLAPSHLIRDPHFWAGGFGYVLAACLNIWVLRHLDLSVVLPMTALTYVWTLVIGRVFLGERLTSRKVGGVGLVIVGVVLIGGF